MPTLHKHRIVPGHIGGTYEPNNVVILTIPEHAEAHRKLWEQHGRWQDKAAWLFLSGRTEEGEALRKLHCGAPKGNQNHKGHRHSYKARPATQNRDLGKWTGRKHTLEAKEKMRQAKLGTNQSESHRQAISKSLIGNKHGNQYVKWDGTQWSAR